MFSKALLVVSALLAASPSHACQTFMVPDSESKVMGKNYVWHVGHGRLYANRKNMKKTALVRGTKTQPAVWTSQYSSLTFNQIAEDFPNGGLNSEGVGIEVLLGQAEYPSSTDKRAVNELQWIQYILDTSKDVEQAVEQAKKVDILPIGNHRLHYHVCDKAGQCAVFEYLDRRLVVSRESETQANPIAVTNSTYAAVGAKRPVVRQTTEEDPMLTEEQISLLPRPLFPSSYDSATQGRLDAFDAKSRGTRSDEVFGMFELMQTLSASPQWQIVYELSTGWVHFRTSRVRELRSVELAGFTADSDRDCRRAIWQDAKSRKSYVLPTLRYDLAAPVAGASKAGETSVVKRADFKYSDARGTVLEESRSFLRTAGVDDSVHRLVEKYPSTHTLCVMEP